MNAVTLTALADRADQMTCQEIAAIAAQVQALPLADAVACCRALCIWTGIRSRRAAGDAVRRKFEGLRENAQRVDAIIGK